VALSSRAVPRVLLLLCGWSAAAAGCRSLDLCSGSECTVTGSGGNDRSGRGGSPQSTTVMAGEGRATAGEGGAAGDAGAGLVASAGSAGLASGPACEGNFAECDGSTLTPCETNVAWQTRHCGACDAVCEGLCQAKGCQPATLVLERESSAFVMSGASALACARYDEISALILIDRDTAKTTILLDGLDGCPKLVAGADRFYAFDAFNEVLKSMRLDGSDLKDEVLASSFDYFGASAHGAYYVDSPYSEEQDVTTYRLWFRATGGTSWKLLREGQEQSYEIVASSAYGVLVFASGAEESALLELHGEDISDITTKAAGIDWDAAAMTAVGPVLTAEPWTGPQELHWLGETVTHYELPDSVYLTNLNVFEDRLVLHGEEDGVGFIQLYGPDGVDGDRRGIALASNFIGMDSRYVWFTVWNTAATRALLRAPWHEINF
jgi:hypothetical protein